MSETTIETAEALGRLVREVWIAWAKEQPAPKPSWLVEWEGLSEPDKDVDRRIGMAIRAAARREAFREAEAWCAAQAARADRIPICADALTEAVDHFRALAEREKSNA